jgi:hypothetical protein
MLYALYLRLLHVLDAVLTFVFFGADAGHRIVIGRNRRAVARSLALVDAYTATVPLATTTDPTHTTGVYFAVQAA